MKIRSFLIKYGEIGIKGSNRHVFEEALVRQIRNALAPLEGGYKVLRRNGRIYAESTDPCGEEEAVDALKHVFGIFP